MSDLLEFNTPALGDLLPERLNQALSAIAVQRRYEDGTIIHVRGDVKPGLSIIRDGAVHLGNTGSDGSYITTSVLGPGHSFGEFTIFADLPRTHDAIAVGETLVDQITRSAFDKLYASEPGLGRILLVATTRRLHAILEFMDDLRRLPLPVRTAKLLATMAASSTDRNVIVCSQTDLAFTLGVTRVSIGKVLKQLSDQRLIRLGYGRIYVEDRVQLKQWIAERTVLHAL